MSSPKQWPGGDFLSEVVITYMSRRDTDRPWVTTLLDAPQPLLRRFSFSVSSWTRVVSAPTNAGWVAGRSLQALALAAISSLDRSVDGKVGYVDRMALEQLSQDVLHASAAQRDGALIALWIASRAWGGGARTQRYTQDALNQPTLLNHLRASEASVRAGKMPIGTPVTGSGMSYWSKWLWALGLSCWSATGPHPLILDSRVRVTLGWVRAREIAATGSRVSGPVGTPTGMSAYQDYLELLQRVAAGVRSSRVSSALDAEKLEWLLWSATVGEHHTMLDDLRH